MATVEPEWLIVHSKFRTGSVRHPASKPKAWSFDVRQLCRVYSHVTVIGSWCKFLCTRHATCSFSHDH